MKLQHLSFCLFRKHCWDLILGGYLAWVITPSLHQTCSPTPVYHSVTCTLCADPQINRHLVWEKSYLWYVHQITAARFCIRNMSYICETIFFRFLCGSLLICLEVPLSCPHPGLHFSLKLLAYMWIYRVIFFTYIELKWHLHKQCPSMCLFWPWAN